MYDRGEKHDVEVLSESVVQIIAGDGCHTLREALTLDVFPCQWNHPGQIEYRSTDPGLRPHERHGICSRASSHVENPGDV